MQLTDQQQNAFQLLNETTIHKTCTINMDPYVYHMDNKIK